MKQLGHIFLTIIGALGLIIMRALSTMLISIGCVAAVSTHIKFITISLDDIAVGRMIGFGVLLMIGAELMSMLVHWEIK